MYIFRAFDFWNVHVMFVSLELVRIEILKLKLYPYYECSCFKTNYSPILLLGSIFQNYNRYATRILLLL